MKEYKKELSKWQKKPVKEQKEIRIPLKKDFWPGYDSNYSDDEDDRKVEINNEIKRIEKHKDEPDQVIQKNLGELDTLVTKTEDLYRVQKAFKMKHISKEYIQSSR